MVSATTLIADYYQGDARASFMRLAGSVLWALVAFYSYQSADLLLI